MIKVGLKEAFQYINEKYEEYLLLKVNPKSRAIEEKKDLIRCDIKNYVNRN